MKTETTNNTTASAAYADKVEFTNLPELTGSPKQIEWAVKIREEILKTRRSESEIRDLLGGEDMDSAEAPDSAVEWAQKKYVELMNRVVGTTSAAVWIDNRRKTLGEIVGEREICQQAREMFRAYGWECWGGKREVYLRESICSLEKKMAGFNPQEWQGALYAGLIKRYKCELAEFQAFADPDK